MRKETYGLGQSVIEAIAELLSKVPSKDQKLTVDGSRITYNQKTKSCNVQPNISRRAFLALTGGLSGLVALDFISPGVVGYAYAGEDEQSDDFGFIITILAKEELGIVAVDVTKSAGSNGRENRISNMNMAIHSFYGSGQAAYGKTDENGIWVVNVRNLSENANDDLVDRYEFWGSLSAAKDGYRIYEVGMVRFASGPPADGQGFVVTTQPENGQPYAQMLTYDGHDIQYKTATIAIAPGNDVNHTVTLKVRTTQKGEVSGSLIHKDTVVATARAQVSVNDAHLEFKGTFGKDFTVGAPTKVRFKVGDTFYEVLTKLECVNPVIDKTASIQGQGQMTPLEGLSVASSDGSLSETFGSANKVKLPDDIPVIGGLELSADLPFLPIHVVVDLNGTVIIATNVADFSLLTDSSGKGRFESWKERTKQDWDSFNKKIAADKEKAIDSIAKAVDSTIRRGSEVGAAPFVSKYTWKLTFEAALVFQYNDKSKVFDGSAAVGVGMVFGISGSKQFLVWVIPCFLAFDFTSALTVAFNAHVLMAKMLKDISWSFKDTQVTFKIYVGASISAGVGVSGVVAVGVRGFGYVQVSLGVVQKDNKPNPHVVVGAGIGAEVFLQAFFFSTKLTIKDNHWPKLYDNWSSKIYDDAAVGLLSESLFDGSLNFADPNEEPVPVSDDILKLTAEFLGALVVNDDEDADNNESEALTYNLLSDTTTSAACDAFDIIEPFDDAIGSMTYDISRGVKPLTDAIVYKETYSDPRSQIVFVDGQLYLLRIATVQISSADWALDPDSLLFVDPDESGLSPDAARKVSRSRILVMAFNGQTWGNADVIDFNYPTNKELNPKKLKRGNMYDYDFQAVSAGGNIHISLVSGSREQGNNAKWWQARNCMVGSYVCYKPGPKTTVSSCTDFRPYGDSVGSIFDKTYISLAYPRIAFFNMGNPEHSRVAALFVGSFDNGDPKVAPKEQHLYDFWAKETGEITSKYQALNEDGTDQTDENGTPLVTIDVTGFRRELMMPDLNCVRDVQIGKGIPFDDAPYMLLTFLVQGEITANTQDMAATCIAEKRGLYRTVDRKVNIVGGKSVRYPVGEEGIMALYLPKNDESDEAKAGKAEVLRVKMGFEGDEDDASVLIFEDSFGFMKPNPFTVSDDGKWIFTTEVQDGTLPANDPLDEEGIIVGGSGAPGEKIELYQIMGATKFDRSNTFTDYFPIAQVSHKMDSLTFVSSNEKGLTFLYNSTASTAKSTANICCTTIPWVTSLQIDGAAPQEIFLGPEDICHLVLNVSNTGNIPIKAFGAQILDKNGNVLFDVKVEDFKNSMIPSTEMVNADGTDYVYNAGDIAGVLLPGTKRLYRTQFKIPKDWRGTIDLGVRLVSVQPAKLGDDSYVEVDDNPNVLTQLDKEPSLFGLDIDSVKVTIDGVGPNNYTTWKDGGENPDPGGGGRMPQTADDITPAALAALGAALGVGGVAAAAAKAHSSDEDESEAQAE